jgi:N-acetylmuramoyl-L-alanine amidase
MKRISAIIFLSLLSSFAFAESVTGLAGWDIYLDPGHSRTENMGIYGYSEAEKNLEVALNLYQLLMDSTDIDTVWLCRTTHTEYIGLTARQTEANNLGAQWYHSIHSDAGGATANSTLMLWGQYTNGQEKSPRGGKAMSDIMIDKLTRGMRTYTVYGSIGDCSFYGGSSCPYLAVNRNTTMASELSEAGFHTNARQNQLNMNAEWKRMEAWTFYWSILEYHDIDIPNVSILNGIIKDAESGAPLNGATASIPDLENSYTTDTWESLFYKYTNDPNLLRNGYYYFESLAADSFWLYVEAPGYYADSAYIAMCDSFLTWKDFSLISQMPPKIVSATPEEGTEAYPAWAPIIFNFSRPMDTLSVEENLSWNPEAHFSYRWSDNNRSLFLYPDSIGFLTEYSITISGNATDVYGHLFDGNGDGEGGDDFTLSFSTSAEDLFPPEVIAMYPPARQKEVELHPVINLRFDDILLEDSLTAERVYLENFSTGEIVSCTMEHSILNGKSLVSLYPDEALDAGTLYVRRVQAGLSDIFGNVSTINKSYTFTTGSNEWSERVIDRFESGVTSNWWEPQQSGSTTGINTDSTGRKAVNWPVNYNSSSTQALEIRYGWDLADSDEWLIREYLGGGAPRNVTFLPNRILQMMVWGNGDSTKIRFAVDDNVTSGTGGHEVSPWIVIDWYGWQPVQWNLAEGQCGTWIGDGVLNGTLRIDSIQLSYGGSSRGQFGKVIVDDLCLIELLPVSIEPIATEQLPARFVLEQNYPNPFNPSTTIRYGLPEAGKVNLSIFNLSGQRVLTLVDEVQNAGYYQVHFDPASAQLPSGVYLYRIQSANFQDVRKMVFIK